jgi:hypothetical protein
MSKRAKVAKIAKAAKAAKITRPRVMAIFLVHRLEWSRIEALSGILWIATCLTS